MVNWLGNLKIPEIEENLKQFKNKNALKSIATYSPFSDIPSRLWQYLIKRARLPTKLKWNQLSKKSLFTLISTLNADSFKINGKGVFKEEFVTCGGVTLDSVNFKTMESKICPSLYFAGEILNVDGLTGGFNFQNAWTGGYIAGSNAAKE